MAAPEIADVTVIIDKMAQALHPIAQFSEIPVVMVGIRTGGVWVAQALHERLQFSGTRITGAIGSLNINFYRDDFTRIGMHPRVTPSDLPFTVDDHHVILADDVLFTGRTIRAALNELFDYGRPSSVTLAVLVERDGRELPIRADVVGQQMTLAPDHYIKLSGPEPLALVLQARS
ncbi:MAG: bifunctional pyr operon transcriptional regulator/uracil phosphoribosyltransferase PyrR [Gammaproteobacteria bacterium]|nr:bifunctional pyr operon transcriptional regulator/uracil phosphoribosyltransferase PyrR [Gammaproteobacteria bacterium]